MPFLFLVIVPFISSFGKGFGTKCPNLARIVSSKQQATDSCGEDSGRTRRGPLPVPRATIRCGFWIFCGMQPIVAAILGDECWMRRYPRCPRWGKCREAAKGVSLVILSRCHSTNRTPSVSPYGLPAPPPGSQGMRQTSPERGGGATAPEGSGAVRRIPIEMHQGEFVQAPLASPGGSQGDQAFSSKCMDRDLKRVSITCLAVARMSTWAT